MWRDTQHALLSAIRVPELPVPSGVTGSTGRFNVYRNNVAVSLRDALADTYPVVKSLVGEEFFNGMAQVFVRKYLPKSPVLAEYGGHFSAFIEGFEPAEAVPYLADISKVEWAWLQAYHAADAEALTMDALSVYSESDLDSLRFETHPSLWLIESPWPVVSIWLAHQNADIPDLTALPDGPEYGLIVRPEMDVDVLVISESACTLIDQLADDVPLGLALRSIERFHGADPSLDLATFFTAGCVSGILATNS